jgi:hypothetical protein
MNCMAENQENYPRRERRGLGKAGCRAVPHMQHNPIAKSVKTRRKSLVSNKVYLQMAGRACSQDGFSITVMNRLPVAWRRQNAISRRTKPNIGSRGSRPRRKLLVDNKVNLQMGDKELIRLHNSAIGYRLSLVYDSKGNDL